MDDDDIVFCGKGGQECEDFIRAVRKAGFRAQKIRDDAWMADFASTCLSGRALRYYESLSADVQGDWRLLRQALLKEYPPAEPDNTMPQAGSASHSLAPFPAAAAPPPTSRRHRARIRVQGTDGSEFGYLGYGKTLYDSCVGAVSSITKAVSISYIPTGQLFEIEIENPNGANQVLGLHWGGVPNSTGPSLQDYAVVTVFDCSGDIRSSSMSWSGPTQTSIWNVRLDKSLIPHWENSSSHSSLTYMVCTLGSYEALALYTMTDATGWCRSNSQTSWTPAKLIVEPLSPVA